LDRRGDETDAKDGKGRSGLTLVYVLDISGESTSRICARMRRRQKQITEVRMTFKLTLSEAQGTVN